MNNLEITYYLSQQQLLLLLSLIDRRPVAGLPSVEEREDWQKLALSLLEDGRIRCENGRLAMDQDLGTLLLTMKDAEQVCALYGTRPIPSSQMIYWGKRMTLLEFLPDGKTRLHGLYPAEAGQLLTEILMPDYPMPEALLDSVSENQILKDAMSRWEAQNISPGDPASRWCEIPEARGVLERWTLKARTRWVWIEDTAAGFILCQGPGGSQATLDTASRRRSLLRELGLEA